ncbi:hypothetical protein [Streptomyces sp. Z26]|uniref:hypothetical protein n=1 Tax=Streptomyces sp. Z26 TaxID=2500177 RepID=UPI000EF14FEA|nr:hypothetical protein [Streptomyces sp. Z26]RLL68396.1 hypothetical protein D7M15_17915 [Streptomyces sp. Z26]
MSFHDLPPARWASQAAEAVRAVNHTTPSGLEFPSDAYDTVAALGEVAERLPQALAQINAYLHAQQSAGRLRSDRGALDLDVELAVEGLTNAARSAQTTAEHLAVVRAGLSHLGTTGH